jgi:hypothetical protein
VRKYLALVLGVLFILSVTVLAFAEETQPQITLSGKLLMRGWYVGNATVAAYDEDGYFESYGGIPVKTNADAFYSTNANIMLDAKVTDNVRGFLEFETAQGGNLNSGLYLWGNYDSKPNSDMLIRQAWIQYTGSGLLNVPSGIKVGHMPFSLGEKQFMNSERFGDDAIVLWTDPSTELHLAIATTKLNEGSVSLHADDIDGYHAILTYMWDKDNTVGANYSFIHEDMDSLNLHNVGIHGNGMISGLSYAAEVDLQFGDVKPADEEKTKFRGWGLLAKVGYMVDPVNLRASFAYGSGDNNPDDSKDNEFETLMGPNYGYTARLVHYTMIYERIIQTSSNHAYDVDSEGDPDPSRNTGIANTTYYNLGIDLNPVKEVSLSLDGFYLDASKSCCGQNTHIGEELDFKGTYKIAKNLSYFVEAAAFWPGKFYTTGEEDPFTDENCKKTVTMAVHGLCLTF